MASSIMGSFHEVWWEDTNPNVYTIHLLVRIKVVMDQLIPSCKPNKLVRSEVVVDHLIP